MIWTGRINANRFHFLSNDDYASKRIGCEYPRRVDSTHCRAAHGSCART